jgi:hypothetical protein
MSWRETDRPRGVLQATDAVGAGGGASGARGVAGAAIDGANRVAVERMGAVRPLLVGVARAGDVVPGLEPGLLLHAGPPIEWERASGPLRGAVIGALLYEGLAADAAGADALVTGGKVRLEPCHHHSAVGPMAGVTSSSMKVWVVEDAGGGGRRSYSNLNEGYGRVLRYGAYAPEVLARLRQINDRLGPLFGAALAAGDPVDLRALVAEALHMGDEGHNRNKAGSLLLMRALGPRVLRAADDHETAALALEYLGGNALAVLNPIMAACKLIADAGHGVAGSTLVSTMARNGTDFGIRVSGLGERWMTAPSPVPEGLYFPGYGPADANPDIGDSTITETIGIGGFAMAAAPAIVTFVGGSAEEAIAASLEMYEITVAESPHFTIPQLGFRGTPTGIDVRKVVELGITPRVNTGIAHREAGVGQIGAGLVRPPMAPFVEALKASAAALGIV